MSFKPGGKKGRGRSRGYKEGSAVSLLQSTKAEMYTCTIMKGGGDGGNQIVYLVSNHNLISCQYVCLVYSP